MDFKMPDFKMPELKIATPLNDASIKQALQSMQREREEKIAREKHTLRALQSLVELGKQNPAIQQHVQTLINNSGTIHNMQSVHSGATGTQNITNNTGLNGEDVLRLMELMREFTEVLDGEHAQQTREVIDELDSQIQQPAPKKGLIKASLTYLKSLFTEIVANPAKSVAKSQFTEYAMKKAPEIIEGIDNLFDSIP